MPDPLLALMNDGDLRYAKVAISAFASIYQPLFKIVCADRSQARLWHAVEAIKRRIVQLFDLQGHIGIKLAAIKAFQKIILVQTRPGDAKAALSGKSSNDAHIGQVPPDHPFLRLAGLETEANERLTQVVTVVFTSGNPDIVMASMNVLATLAKYRQSLGPIVFEALISWTPSALTALSHTLIRSVEKTLKLLYLHFHPSRNSWAGSYSSQIIEAVETQKLRMDTAAREEEEKREKEATGKIERLGQEINGATSKPKAQKRKRVRFAEEDDEKTPPQAAPTPPPPAFATTSDHISALTSQTGASVDLDQGRKSASAFQQSSSLSGVENPLAGFDVTTLPLHLVIELILANLQVLTEEDLHSVISRTRSSLDQVGQNGPAVPSAPPPLHPGPPPHFSRPETIGSIEEKAMGAGEVNGDEDMDAGPQDPLQLDVEDEEVLEEAEKTLEVEGAHDGLLVSTALQSFSLRPPGQLEAEECTSLLRASVSRICDNGPRIVGVGRSRDANGAGEDGAMNAQLWSMLVTRLATRGFRHGRSPSTRADDEQGMTLTWKKQADSIRQMMLDFVVLDFANRVDFAVQWMAEEFRGEVVRRKLNATDAEDPGSEYADWLHRLVSSLGTTLDSKDRSLIDFLNRVPKIPDSIIDTLETLCLDKVKMRIGFGMLRELAIQRMPSRDKICSILLALTRNEEKAVRSAAIITVRNWVRANGTGNSEGSLEMEEMVLEAAREGLRRLSVRDPASEETNGVAEKETEAAGSQVKVEVMDEDGDDTEPASVLDDPAKEVKATSDVIRLVELPFALCVRVSNMLDEIFEAFPQMAPTVQEAVKKTIVPLIQTLGPNNAKLQSLIRRHPAGSESLAVGVFTVMTEKQKSKKIVELVKEMAEEKSDIDPRFLIPILPDLVKSEIIKFLPRVVTIMASDKPEDRATIKAVFTSIVTMPAQGFGSISTNLPRVRSSELLSPVELMSLLHHSEREIGLKTTAEAIRICFGMTDIFRSEVLGAVLNLILEEPNLPVLFMRTAIMAVRTYKSLSSYISTIFLSRLITKKVWQQTLLWDGFVLCAKQTAPASFGALIQLPKEQLRDVITRQPDLRTGLREYLVKKAGGHKVRLKNFLELLGESVDEAATTGGPGPGGSDAVDNLSQSESQHSTPQPPAAAAES